VKKYTDFHFQVLLITSCKMALNITKNLKLEMDIRKKLHNELFEYVVCQKCEEVPKEGPIYTCDNGNHATCTACFQTSKVCKCKANIRIRTNVLEKIRTTLPLSCKFRKNGCNAILTVESLLYHEVDCQFRLIFCPFRQCQKEVPNRVFKNLQSHLTEHHKDIRNANTSYVESDFRSLYITPGHTKLVLNNAQFYHVIYKSNVRYYNWVYYYGSPEEAKNYHCTIKLFGGSGDDEYSFNGPPRSLDESQDQIIKEEHALSLGTLQVIRIKGLQCSVKVSCPKDEAKDEDVESGISDNENTTSNTST
jgi:hypothetical protein